MPLERVTGLTNAEFIERYAAPGRIGLVSGSSPSCRLIGRAQRHVTPDQESSLWSHAFLFQGRRPDGHHWVVESDLEIRRKHIALGVQENRAAKFHDESEFPCLAIMDLPLDPAQTDAIFKRALDMVAGHVRYSLRELVGTLMALRHQGLRGQDNLLARDHSIYCSAFVRHVFHAANFDLTPGLEVKNTTPEDIFQSTAVRHTWLLERPRTPRPRLLTRLKNKRLARKKAL